MRAGLIQLNSSDDPVRNLPVTVGFVREAAGAGAELVLTPEVTNCVSNSRSHQRSVLARQKDDITLSALRDEARKAGIWLVIGSLGLLSDDDIDDRFVNRSFLIAPDGEIVAHYDKIHMFDVDIDETETFRESAGYQPGYRAVVADSAFGKIGLTICYDVRFPHLHRMLSKAGAGVLTAPAAFSPVSGAAHWHALLRARAIENGCFVLAPAQTGTHNINRGAPRRTYGHSLAVSPWGKVLADAGDAPGTTIVDLDLNDIERCRKMIPSLTHDRPIEAPDV